MLIIDMGIEIHKTVHGNRDKFIVDELGNKPNYDIFAFLLLASITYKIKLFGCSKRNPVVLAMDSKNSWRKEFFEKNKVKYFNNYGKKVNLDDYGYKINRSKSSDYDWNKIYSVANDVLNMLDKHSDIIVIKVDNAEADDIVGVCAKYEAERGNEVYISSSDKDFRQLLINHKNIHLWHPIEKTWIVEESPALFMQVLYLTGDAGDDVPQTIPRMGGKTALKTIPKLDELLATDADFKFRYETNVTLINFEFIPENIKTNIINELTKKNHFQYSQMDVINFFSKYKISALKEESLMLSEQVEPTNLTRKFHKKEVSVNQKVIKSFLDELF